MRSQYYTCLFFKIFCYLQVQFSPIFSNRLAFEKTIPINGQESFWLFALVVDWDCTFIRIQCFLHVFNVLFTTIADLQAATRKIRQSSA